MLKILDINNIKPSDYSEVSKIKLTYKKGQYNTYKCNNICAYDIETSSGFCTKSGEVIKFDHSKYNKTIYDTKNHKDIPNPNYDENYKNEIDTSIPVSIEYAWSFAVESADGNIYLFVGRDDNDYLDFMMTFLKEVRRQSVYGFNSYNRDVEYKKSMKMKVNVSMMIYSHNYAFEHQHLRNVWEDEFTKAGRNGEHTRVFARSARKVIKSQLKFMGVSVEHRCSLFLTQKKLDNWCIDESLPVVKQHGFDYDAIKTPATSLTDSEWLYIYADTISMLYGLEKYREANGGDLWAIELTQTGSVRREYRKTTCLGDKQWAEKCANITHNYTIDFFRKLTKLFAGGWTHGNKRYIDLTCGKVVKDENGYHVENGLTFIDFASSYPYVLCSQLFPVDDFEPVDVSDFDDLASQDIFYPDYRWFAKIKFTGVKSIIDDSYWSSSKTENLENQVLDNGRIVTGDFEAYLTDWDWDTFKQAYHIKHMEVLELYKSKAGYLSAEFIKTLLGFYGDKTKLKGLKGATEEETESIASRYRNSKARANSSYGCAVTKIVTDKIEQVEQSEECPTGWKRTPCDEEHDYLFYDAINQATDENTFLSYQNGIWCTASARHNLWSIILYADKYHKLPNGAGRTQYCDTDSWHGFADDDMINFINSYNLQVEEMENKASSVLGIDPELYAPKTVKGVAKRLGVAEFEHEINGVVSKSLGAKRYVTITIEDGEPHFEATIAGLPKSAGVKKVHELDLSDFTNHMYWNTADSGKLTAYYNDNQPNCTWTDRDGKRYYSMSKYGICLKPTTFDLSFAPEFEKFLQTLITQKIDRDDEFFNDVPKLLR